MCLNLEDVGLQSPSPIHFRSLSIVALPPSNSASFDAFRSPVSIVDSPPQPSAALQFSSSRLGHSMGNISGKEKATKQGPGREVHLKVIPPLDPDLLYWLDRDIQMMQNFTPSNPLPITPPERYQEYMRLHGWMDLDMDDPELAPLFK